MRKGYLVTYSTGSYDMFFIQNDRVYFSKSKAKKRCKELDKLHKTRKPMFLSNRDEWGDFIELSEEDAIKTYWNCEYEADCYREDHPEEFPELWKNDMTEEEKKAWEIQETKNDEHYKEILHQIVAKYHPEWSEKDIKKAIEIEEQNEHIREEEYGVCQIEEIDIDDEE